MKKTFSFLCLLLMSCTSRQPEKQHLADSALTNSSDTSMVETPAVVKAEQEDPYLIIPGKSFGPINARTTRDSLIAWFGKNQLFDTTLTIYLGGDPPEPDANGNIPPDPTVEVTYIYRNTDKEMEVYWNETLDTITSVGTKQQRSMYHTKEGIKAGININELAAINDSPMYFYGFGWDFGGLMVVADNQYKTPKKGIVNEMIFKRKIEIIISWKGNSEDNSVYGDEIFSTEMPLLKTKGKYVYVYSLNVIFKQVF
jgi:hypothetical protein